MRSTLGRRGYARAVAIFRPEDEAHVRELLAALERPVELLVALGPEETPLPGARDVDFGGETVRVVEEVAALSDNLSCRVEDEPAGFDRYPAVALLPRGEDVGLRYYGLPWGYELSSLVGGVVEAGRRRPSLRPESLERLAALDRDLRVDVFVTPT
jgi:alkyl hydroperoxide reductase subunit AhpF